MKKKRLTFFLIPVITLFFVLTLNELAAQDELKKYEVFFASNLKQYQDWLSSQNFNYAFSTGKVEIVDDKLNVILYSNFQTDDSLKMAWEWLRDAYFKKNNERIEDFLLKYTCYLMQTTPDSTQLHIIGRTSTLPLIKISFKDYTLLETFFPATMEGGAITVPKLEIKSSNVETLNLNESQTVHAISDKIKKYLYENFSQKGKWWYRPQFNNDEFYTGFIIRVTCINKEVITDGYFEYIEIHIDVEKLDANIIIHYDIYASYASGILCPEFRDSYYTPIGENNYPGKMKSYTQKIRRKIEDLIMSK